MLGRYADVEYCADDGGEVKLRYVPGVSPLQRDFEATGPHTEMVAGTLEISADIHDGQNAFRRFEPYPLKLLQDQHKGMAAFEEMFPDTLEELAIDEGAAWHLIPGPAAEVHLFYGSLLTHGQADALPERAIQTMRGRAPDGNDHKRVAVGARITAARAEERFTLVDDAKLDPKRYDAVTRVIRNFASKAKLGFVIVPTSATTERELYEEAFHDG